MENLDYFLYFISNIDSYLITFSSQYGILTYIVLFAIIFCETGLVVTPFLPGDSLLFAAGSIAANNNHPLNIQLLLVLLTLAAILGNKLNYLIGRLIGPKIFSYSRAWLFNIKYLEQAHRFYEKHGGKTIIIARFLPILRTFAPFVAGIGYMSIRKFSIYNILSGFLWISSLLGAGYFLGKLPFIQENFSWVIYSIALFTLLPPTFAFVIRKTNSRKT